MKHRYLIGFKLAFCLLILSGIVSGCRESSKSMLAKEPAISGIFSETEIRDLEIILDFFESQICDFLQVQSDSIADCYTELFKSVGSAQSTGIIYIPVSYDAQKEMYDQLSDAAFTEIWLKGKATDQVSGATSDRLTLSFDGKYMQFLDALRTDYTLLEAYRRSFREERKMTPEMIEGVLYNHHLYNMQDIRMRLFVALHYLTLNDVYERKGM